MGLRYETIKKSLQTKQGPLLTFSKLKQELTSS